MIKNIFKNKSVLITGGTGTFGHRCTSLLLNLKCKKIVIFSRDEFKQFHMKKKFPQENIRYFLGDIRDYERLKMALFKIDFVIHAAALKQVPQAEVDPIECIKTNIFGTQNVIQASIDNSVQHVHALSTDKASNPINLYGSTKLCLEKLVVSANHLTGLKKTKFSVSRYGNVVGSRGSITTVFEEHLKQGKGFFPITDLEMTRFWLRLDDGVNFVLKNISRAFGGELFIPKIKSVRILDLAKSYNNKYSIKVIGIRPGEKLHESLISEEEAKNTVEYKDFFIIKPSIIPNERLNTRYLKTKIGENGRKSKIKLYRSDLNSFLNIKELKNYK